VDNIRERYYSAVARADQKSPLKIPVRDDLKYISETTRFSYQEVWLMSQFVREDALEDALECAALFGDSVAEYLISVGAAPAEVIHAMIKT